MFPYRVMCGSVTVTHASTLDSAIEKVIAENASKAGRPGFRPRRVVDVATERTVYPVETNS